MLENALLYEDEIKKKINSCLGKPHYDFIVQTWELPIIITFNNEEKTYVSVTNTSNGPRLNGIIKFYYNTDMTRVYDLQFFPFDYASPEDMYRPRDRAKIYDTTDLGKVTFMEDAERLVRELRKTLRSVESMCPIGKVRDNIMGSEIYRHVYKFNSGIVSCKYLNEYRINGKICDALAYSCYNVECDDPRIERHITCMEDLDKYYSYKARTADEEEYKEDDFEEEED